MARAKNTKQNSPRSQSAPPNGVPNGVQNGASPLGTAPPAAQQTGAEDFRYADGSPRIAIIGTGFGGLGMAITLRRAGINNFLLIEKRGDIGGTWRDNTYPGCACDVPSHLYSYSFEINPNWSHVFPPRDEVFAYLTRLARKYQLYAQTRFNTEIATCHFDEDAGHWRLKTRQGEEIEADIVIAALGQLNRPKVPQLKGASDYRGVIFHSAEWQHGHDFKSKRIGVIGNGPSAAQFIPALVRSGAQVRVFHRSPAHVMPRNDKPYPAAVRFLFRWVPGWVRAYRFLIYWLLERNFVLFNEWRQGMSWPARFGLRALNLDGGLTKMIAEHFDEQVKDPKLRKILQPDYPIGCKRVVVADDYYPALQAENCELVVEPIQRLTAKGVEVGEGKARTHYDCDAIIYGTGFATSEFLSPMKIVGRRGHSLNKSWANGAEAYLGIAMPEFPNFFMLYGPNTNLGHNSIIFMLECQIRYIMSALKKLQQNKALYMEVRQDAMAQFSSYLHARLKSSVWEGDCSSWYKNDAGRVVNNWPDYTFRYARATAQCRDADYQFHPPARDA